MNILYITRAYLSDSVFPLIRALQNQGVNIDTYIFGGITPAGILDFEPRRHRYGVWKASTYPELVSMYGNYVDLNRIRFISVPNGSKGLFLKYIIIFSLFLKFLLSKYNVIHFTWPLLGKSERILYRLPFNKLLTVHDPIPHSSQEHQEKDRSYAFKYCSEFVLLSETLKKDFSFKYNIDLPHIHISKMGEFDYLRNIYQGERSIKSRYIIFFGQIAPHKGLELLLKAMIEVHKIIPELYLVIAGGGKLYFNFDDYKDLNFIIPRFKYIGVCEMVDLIINSELVVCPYKDATQSGVVQTSFSLNTPVLATNVGALPSMISDNITGKIIPPNDVNALIESIIDLVNDPIKIKTMSNNIDNMWRPKMKWDKIANDYIDIYKIMSDRKNIL